MAEKYIAWMVIAFSVAIGASMVVDSYGKNQCKQEALKAGKSAEDIMKICR